MKKIGTAVLSVIIAAGLLSACGNAPEKPESSAETTVPQTVTPVDTAEKSNSVVQGKAQTFSYKGSDGEDYKAEYRLPELNFKSDDAKAVNAEIKEAYAKDFSEAEKAQKEKTALATDSIDYEANQNDDVVSIIIKRVKKAHTVDYSIYNFNSKTKKRMDNTALLEYLGRDYEKTFATLKEKLQDDYTSKFKLENFPDDYYIQLEATIGDKAVKSSSLFLSSDASLYAICTEHAGNGNKEYYVMLSID